MAEPPPLSAIARLTLRLRITWLTIAAIVMFMALTLLSPGFDQTNGHYARSLSALALTLDFPGRVDLLHGFRGAIAADMLFLLAYGFLLRASAQWHLPQRVARTAAGLTWLLMAFDAVENVAMLTMLSALTAPGAATLPGHATWTTIVGNVAAVGKWILAGLIGLLLAYLWRTNVEARDVRDRLLVRAIALLFAAGGIASFTVALLFFFPQLRLPPDLATAAGQGRVFQLLRVGASIASYFALIAPAFALLGQIVVFGLPALLLRLLVLCRVPFGVMLAIVAFGPIALGPQTALLGAILNLNRAHLLFQTTLASVLVTLAAGVQVNLVRAYAHRRFEDRNLRLLRHTRLRTLVFWTTVIAGVWLPICSWLASSTQHGWALLTVPAGTGAALAVAASAEYLGARFSDPLTARDVPQYVIPSLKLPWLSRLLRDAQQRTTPGPVSSWVRLTRRVTAAWLGDRDAPGYIGRVGGIPFLLPGHTLALTLFIATFVFYIVVITSKLWSNLEVGGAWVPTLLSIVLLILMIAWLLGALAFFLDRYRVPLIAGLAALSLVTGTLKATDHVFAVQETQNHYEERTPSEVLAPFSARGPIVVSAAGGGIQAGVWAMEVLEGLDRPHLLNGTLRDRVALVSAVSGGSMGALYFGADYDTASFPRARALAAESSLDDVATAFVGLDIWRGAGFPWVRPLARDRGRALEETWRQRAEVLTRALSMQEWAAHAGRAGASGHVFPAFLFNSTIVETGQPLAFATTQFPSAPFRAGTAPLQNAGDARPRAVVVESFNTMFDLYDQRTSGARDVGLSVTTAARLSAAFPYVSPAAAPNWTNPEAHKNYHLVDGGYYDNYGLVGLSQWLDDALSHMNPQQLPSTVTVVIIRDEEDPAKETVPRQGWLHQLVAPPVAVLGTRTYGQWVGGRAALRLLEEKWRHRVAIREVSFVYPLPRLRRVHHECGNPPLSWLLTGVNDGCVKAAWLASQPAIDEFMKIVGAPAGDAPAALEQVPRRNPAPAAATPRPDGRSRD